MNAKQVTQLSTGYAIASLGLFMLLAIFAFDAQPMYAVIPTIMILVGLGVAMTAKEREIEAKLRKEKEMRQNALKEVKTTVN